MSKLKRTYSIFSGENFSSPNKKVNVEKTPEDVKKEEDSLRTAKRIPGLSFTKEPEPSENKKLTKQEAIALWNKKYSNINAPIEEKRETTINWAEGTKTTDGGRKLLSTKNTEQTHVQKIKAREESTSQSEQER